MFALVYEVTDECDFTRYLAYEGDPECKRSSTCALIETSNIEFHLAHLCDQHGPIIMRELQPKQNPCFDFETEFASDDEKMFGIPVSWQARRRLDMLWND